MTTCLEWQYFLKNGGPFCSSYIFHTYNTSQSHVCKSWHTSTLKNALPPWSHAYLLTWQVCFKPRWSHRGPIPTQSWPNPANTTLWIFIHEVRHISLLDLPTHIKSQWYWQCGPIDKNSSYQHSILLWQHFFKKSMISTLVMFTQCL